MEVFKMPNEDRFPKKCCKVVGYQPAEVSAPITVTPYAHLVSTKTFCFGKPLIKTEKENCDGKGEEKCKFKIKQKLCVEVTVEFGAKSVMEDPRIECFKASDKDDFSDCDKDDKKYDDLTKFDDDEDTFTGFFH